jgi:hypothetical protein
MTPAVKISPRSKLAWATTAEDGRFRERETDVTAGVEGRDSSKKRLNQSASVAYKETASASGTAHVKVTLPRPQPATGRQLTVT